MLPFQAGRFGRGALDAAAGGGGGPLVFNWTASAFKASTPAPPADFTAINIGTASSDRFVVVAVSWEGTVTGTNMDIPAVSGVLIDGSGGTSFTSLTQAVYSRPTSGSRGTAIYYGNIPTGTTNATVRVTGFSNGWVNSIVINVGTITGSATTSNASGNNSTAAAYPNGLTTSPALTVPANGVTVICAVGESSSGGASAWTNTTQPAADKDQFDGGGGGFNVMGSMAHLTTSATVTENSLTGGTPTGWVAAAFQP